MEFSLSWLSDLVSRHDITVLSAIKNIAGNPENVFEPALEFEKSQFAPLWGGNANKAALASKIKH